MSRLVQKSWLASACGAAVLALPLLALSACADNDDKLAEQLAAAEAAAEKAVAAQRAAEKAAAIAAGVRPAPPPAEPTVIDDMDFESDNLEGDREDRSESYDSDFSMGGSGQTISPDGVVIPGQGA